MAAEIPGEAPGEETPPLTAGGGNCPPGWSPAPESMGASPGACVNPEGHVVAPEAFGFAAAIDSRVSPGQWQTWINMGLRDPACPPGAPFKSENRGADGQPIGGCFEKPVDCPGGTTKYGQTECLPLDHPKVTGQPGGGAGTAPPPPDEEGQAQLEYTGDPLQDALYQFFNQRAGIFGKRNPYLSGATPRTGTEDLKAKPLPGGGVWWGDTGGLSSALAPFTAPAAPAPMAAAPTPAAPAALAAPASVASRDPSGRSVIPSISPLTSALLTSSSFGTNQKRPRARGPLEQALLGMGV